MSEEKIQILSFKKLMFFEGKEKKTLNIISHSDAKKADKIRKTDSEFFFQ